MPRQIATVDIKAGMVVTSLRTASYVYSFGDDMSRLRTFPMKGKAIVLQELTKVRLKRKKLKYNPETGVYDTKDGSCVKNMLLLSHYKHGIVMYFAHNKEDAKWRLIEEKATKNE